MNKTLLIGIVVVILLLIGGYFIYSSGNDDGIEKTTNQEENNSETSGGVKSSLKAMLASGGSRKCDITSGNSAAFSSGTVYVSDGKMKGEFTTTSNGQSMKAYMISDGEYMYSWTDITSSGFKFPITQTESQETEQNSVDINQEIDWNC